MLAKKIRRYAAGFVMEAILIAICIGLTFASKSFLTAGNLLDVLYAVSMQGLIAFGMTMVIIAGEIDLSVGSAAAFSGCLAGVLILRGVPAIIAVLIPLVVGFALGLFTGWVRTKHQVPTFITTLALFTGLKGAALTITKGMTLTPSYPKWFLFLGGGRIPITGGDHPLGLPFPAVLFVLGFAAISFLMNHTSFGRSVYAVGGNAAAARLCGIKVPATRMLVLAITGMLAALSGIMLSSRIASATPTVAVGWELDVIAAVIIGGTSFTGGVGKVWGTLIGIVFIGVLANGMTLLNVASETQYLVRGLLILVAVFLNRVQEKRVAY